MISGHWGTVGAVGLVAAYLSPMCLFDQLARVQQRDCLMVGMWSGCVGGGG